MELDKSFFGPKEKFVPTTDYLLKTKIELADLKKEDVLFDLGCGDGKVLIYASQHYGVTAVGVDIDRKIIEEARENVSKLNLDHLIEIHHEDFLKTDLSRATVLILYLTRNSLGQLSLKLENELQPGTKIITHTFDIPAWSYHQKIEVTSPKGAIETLYLYIKD